jgi:hypothetical protein
MRKYLLTLVRGSPNPFSRHDRARMHSMSTTTNHYATSSTNEIEKRSPTSSAFSSDQPDQKLQHATWLMELKAGPQMSCNSSLSPATALVPAIHSRSQLPSVDHQKPAGRYKKCSEQHRYGLINSDDLPKSSSCTSDFGTESTRYAFCEPDFDRLKRLKVQKNNRASGSRFKEAVALACLENAILAINPTLPQTAAASKDGGREGFQLLKGNSTPKDIKELAAIDSRQYKKTDICNTATVIIVQAGETMKDTISELWGLQDNLCHFAQFGCSPEQMASVRSRISHLAQCVERSAIHLGESERTWQRPYFHLRDSQVSHLRSQSASNHYPTRDYQSSTLPSTDRYRNSVWPPM